MSRSRRMPDECTSNGNTETTADPMSFDDDEQKRSVGSLVDDGLSVEPGTIEVLASSALSFSYQENPTPGAASGHPSWGHMRRLSSGMEEAATNITEGQLRTIDLELDAQRHAALGSLTRDGDRQSPQKAELPADLKSRRDAVARTDCDYGMDAVGNHVAAVMKWIAEVHEMDDETVEAQHSSGFMTRRPLALRSRACPEDENCVQDNIFPEGVKVNGSLEMALVGLNSCLYEAERQRREEEKNEEANGVVMEHVGDVDRIVEAVARIPSLMKTITLIEDNEDRDFVLSNPAIRRAMLCPYSILSVEAAYEELLLKQATQNGDVNELTLASPSQDRGESWLVEMLKSSDNNLTDKAIDYMEVLSFASVNDYISIRQPPVFVRQRGIPFSPSRRAPLPSKDDEIKFNHLKDSLFRTVGSLKLLIPHFFKLYTPDIERASTLPVIRRALDDAISQPFFMCIIFFDMVFHIILLLSFRYFNFQLVAVRNDFDNINHTAFGPNFLGSIGQIAAFYLSFRVVGNIVSMSRVSWHVFCANFFNLWQLVEVATMTMVMASLGIFRKFDLNDLIEYKGNTLFVFNAFSTGLVWLNFVGYLRVLNWKLATFVLAILQIICDISLFILLMFILVLAFGDMFYTIIAADPAVCSNTESLLQILLEKLGLSTDVAVESVPSLNRTGEFPRVAHEDSPICESRGQSYFAIYRVLVGDVSADEFAHNPVTTIIFIVMTFLGVIIMLNILIAIVDESYERSTMRAERLFGRARIALVSKIAALEELLHPICYSWQSTLSRGFLLYSIMRLVAFTTAGTIAFVLVDIAEMTHTAFVNLQISRSGAIALTVVVIVPFGLFILISTTFLFTGWEEGRTRFKFLQKIQHTRILKYCFMYPVTFIVQNLLGTSQVFQRKSRSREDEWHGRLNHIKQEVKKSITESESRMKDMISRLETKLEKEAEQCESDAVELEKRLDEMEERAIATRKRELENLEKRVIHAMTNALSEQLNKGKGKD